MQRKSNGRTVRVKEVPMECNGEAGFVGSGFLRQGESDAWRSLTRLPKGRLQLGGSKDGGWVYTDPEAGSQNGNSCRAAALLALWTAELAHNNFREPRVSTLGSHTFSFGPQSALDWMEKR